MVYILRPEMYGKVFLKPKMTKVLKEKTGCRDESFYEGFQYEFVDYVRRVCGNESACTPIELPTNLIRRCETQEESDCADDALKHSIRKSRYQDSIPCTKIEYGGDLVGQMALQGIVIYVSTCYMRT